MAVKKIVNGLVKITSVGHLERLARVDEKYRALAVAAAENIGASLPKDKGWEAAISALRGHWSSMVGEYGYDEEEAEKDLVDEINFVRDCVK